MLAFRRKSFIGYGPEELTDVAVPKYMIGNASKVAVVMPLTLSHRPRRSAPG